MSKSKRAREKEKESIEEKKIDILALFSVDYSVVKNLTLCAMALVFLAAKRHIVPNIYAWVDRIVR